MRNNLTEMESKVLKNIVVNELNDWNGEEPERDADPASIVTWVDSLDCGPEEVPSGKNLSGVVSSLVKKGLVNTDGDSICMTKDGLEAYWVNK